MEIDVTSLITIEDEITLAEFSTSAYLGGPDAAQRTWRNAMKYCVDPPEWLASLDLGDLIDALTAYGCGELGLEGRSDQALLALTLQVASGACQEVLGYDSFESYEEALVEGCTSHMIHIELDNEGELVSATWYFGD